MKQFEILFVRHAYSCANEWQDKSKLGRHWLYDDPEITTQGIKESIAVGKSYENPFTNQEPFTLASSVMLRAQQTAYLMFGKRLNLPIHVFPYIGEIYPTFDNRPLSMDKQQKRYEKNPYYTSDPSMTNLVYERGIDFRHVDSTLSSPVSSYKAFIKWIVKPENEHFFAKGSDDILRAIIVTHSGFMRKHFPYAGVKKYKNNDGILVSLEIDPAMPSAHEKEILEYFPAQPIKDTLHINAKCPDCSCSSPPPCSYGGTRKMRRKRRTKTFKRIELLN